MATVVGSSSSGSGSGSQVQSVSQGSQIPGESPKKKPKISLPRLTSVKRASSGSRFVTVGEILTLPNVSEGTISKSDTAKEFSVYSVIMRFVGTENRVGRLPATEKGKTGNRFVYIADYTSFMRIGMDAVETGLIGYDIEAKKCSDDARLFFSAEVSGTVSWVPTKRKPEKPTFFLNNGTVKKVAEITWDDKYKLMFPTSDVCRMLLKSPFASSALFTTKGFCVKIDVQAVSDSNAVVISVEDPVGYAAVEINLEENNSKVTKEVAEAFIEKKGIEKGVYLFVKGTLEMSLLDNNTLLKAKETEVILENVSKEDFADYVKSLMGTPLRFFPGVVPEEMCE